MVLKIPTAVMQPISLLNVESSFSGSGKLTYRSINQYPFVHYVYVLLSMAVLSL